MRTVGIDNTLHSAFGNDCLENRVKWRSSTPLPERPRFTRRSEGMPQRSFIHAVSRVEDCRSLYSSVNDLESGKGAGAMNAPHFDLNKQTNTNSWRLAA